MKPLISALNAYQERIGKQIHDSAISLVLVSGCGVLQRANGDAELEGDGAVFVAWTTGNGKIGLHQRFVEQKTGPRQVCFCDPVFHKQHLADYYSRHNHEQIG